MLESRRCVSRSTYITRSLLWFGVLAAGFCPPCLAVPPNPVPYIDIVSPASVHPGVTGVTLTVIGANFVNTSTVKWNGISLTTTFVGSKKLTAAVPDSFVAAVGLGAISVVSPAPGGGISNVGYFPVASFEATPTFPGTPSSTITLGPGTMPQGIITADFNGDGILDLAVAEQGTNAISILLGNGDGTFTATVQSPIAAGLGANWLVAGDFNEDGNVDLAVANVSDSGTSGVSIFLGDGTGAFTLHASFPTGNEPFAVATADFNKDGHLDLAVSNSDGTITVLLGDGTATFTAGGTLIAGALPQEVVVGDFNEDGNLDVAVTNETDGTVSIFFGDGLGGFSTQTVVSTGGSGSPIGLIAADLEGDGHLDLAAVNASDVAILSNSPVGTFTLIRNPTTGSGDLIAGVAGDYNGDGKVDLVVSDRGAGEAFLILGDVTTASPTILTFTTAPGSFGVATADFNGDGALDLAFANGTANNISIFLQQLPVGLAPTSIAFGNQIIATTSAPQTVVLTNNDGGALNIASIAISGADAGDFTVTGGGTCVAGTPVANSATCTITITFTPSVLGARTGTLTITDDAGNSPQTLALTGTGVGHPPVISKAFGASTIPLNGTTTLTLTIMNPVTNAIALTGIAFSDTLPAGLQISTPNGLSGSCGGTVTATAGTGSLSLTGGSLASVGSCAIVVNVTGISAGAQPNTTGNISSNESGPGTTSNTATVTVVAPPVITKSFGVGTIVLNGSTTLTFHLSNPNSGTSLTGVGFTDTLPSGLVVSTPNGLSGTCGGGTITDLAGSGSVTLSAATLLASASCMFSVNVTGTTAGTKSNTTNATSTEGGAGTTASASLVVEAPPSISKAFGVAGIALNGTTSLTFTIANPGANTAALMGVAFTDTLPVGIVVATPNGLVGVCGGTVTATAGAGSLNLAGGTVASSSSCTIIVNVTGTTGGGFTNTTGAVSSTNGGTGNTASANLSVAAPPVIAKSFGAATIPLNGSTSLNFTVTNPGSNTIALTGVAFTDSLPAGLVVASPPALSGSCGGGTITATAGSGSVSLSSATLATSGSCAFSVNVTGTTAGVKNNAVTVTSTTAGTGNTANASVTVVAPPTISKAFGSASIPLNGITTLTFTVSNPNAGTGLTGIGFTDALPTGLIVATPNGMTGSCGGGTITGVAGAGSVTLSGATLASSSSCTFAVNVTGTSAGAKNNTSAAVTSTNGGTGATASASLAVVAPPSISKAFGAANIPPGGSTSLTFTITNPSANTVALTGVAFTDTLPATLFVAAPNGLTGTCPGGTITATAGTASVSLSGASVATNTSCTFAVNVTGAVIGNYTNTTGAVASTNGGTGNTATASLAVNLSAAITSANNTLFVVGTAGSFTVTTAGAPAPSLVKTGALPAGVNFTDNVNGTATLAGTPAAGTGGVYPITITAHNGVGSDAVQNFTLTVNQGAAITSTGSTTFMFGAAGTFSITATGMPVPVLSETGALPAGVTFTPNGNGTATLAGTPAVGSGGVYAFTITAHNGVGPDATQTFTLTIAKATPAITWAVPTAITYGTALSATQLDATANIPGTFMYSPAAGVVLGAGSRTLSMTFTPTDSTDYSPVTVTVTLTVNKAAPVITWAAPAAIPYGTALSSTQLDATSSVAGTFVYTPPVGTVIGGGSQTLSATFTPTDATDYSPVTTQVSFLVNAAASTTTVSASPSPATPGVPVTFTITVSSSAGTPAGSVNCLDGTTSLGTVTLSTGVATLSISTLATGAHSITCTYAGSANFSASTSTALETISGADFSFVSAAASSTVIPGKPTTISFTLTPQGGFIGQVQFSVSGVPPEATAVFAPAVLALSGSGPATETLTITTPPSFIYNAGVHASPFRSAIASILWMPLAGLVFGAAGLARRRNRRIFLPLVLLALSSFAVALAGCASSSSFQQSTPAGPYALTITATSGTTSHATVVNVIVR